MNKDVLYYPHINFSDSKLIKGMSLFYDRIYRLVPSEIQPVDHPDLEALLEEGKVGRPINPAAYAHEASAEFLSKMDIWGAAALAPSDDDYKHDITKIHKDKTDEKVRALFEELGYGTNNDWMNVPTDIASNFMLYLAKVAASKNQLSMETNDWGAWTATNYFGADGGLDDFYLHPSPNVTDANTPYGLFSLTLHEFVPIDIGNISAKKIVEFREKRSDEISTLRDHILDLHNKLQLIDSDEVKSGIIEDSMKSLLKAHQDYKKSMDIISTGNLLSGFKMLAFPAKVSAIFSPSLTPYIAAGAVTISALYHRTRRSWIKR